MWNGTQLWCGGWESWELETANEEKKLVGAIYVNELVGPLVGMHL